MSAVLWLLVAQGVLGAIDVLLNHEWLEDLPHRPGAMLEQAIHGGRELLYALVFAGLAWFEWRGAYALLFAGLLIIEVLLTAWDFVEEDRTRRLSAMERVMHLALSMGGGAYCALLAPVLLRWQQQVTSLHFIDYGPVSWLLSVMAVGVLVWGVRDAMAAWSMTSRLPVAVTGEPS
ncbi:hypothetical protein [Herbaspirillum seropedicae]|uniref:hypothetical protein n=1 Tax=Herbaspirillum seropedicae TaxID=964 RepID=UPI003FCCA4B9